MIYLISDLHFGHENIIKYSSRPFSSVEEMNETLIKNWNDVVKDNDIVYHLGDFCFLKYNDCKNILRRLNGNINMILGNHDKVIKDNKSNLLNSKLVSSIDNYIEIDYCKQKIILFHFAMRVWNQSHRGSWLCFGHSHGSMPPFGKSVDVGVDSKFITDEYRPISFDELKIFMDNQKFEKAVYHND